MLQYIIRFYILYFLVSSLSVGHTHTGANESQMSKNPEDLHPEIHFHPTHLHNANVDGEREQPMNKPLGIALTQIHQIFLYPHYVGGCICVSLQLSI